MEEEMTQSPVMWKSILITLVTLSAVIVVPSLVLAGETKYNVMGFILLLHHTMLLNTLQGLDVSFPLGNIILMLKHFGHGGLNCIHTSDIFA